MKKTYLIVFFLLFSLCQFGQSARIITVETAIFKIKYDENLEQPIEAAYQVKCTAVLYSRKGLRFYANDSIHTSDNADYKYNEWDKGHLVPVADFACEKEALKKTFSYINCALQHEGLNRGPWKSLEHFERKLAKIHNNVMVLVEVIFDKNPKRVKGGAAIPKGFKKTISYEDTIFTFMFPNKDVAGQNFWGFEIKN